MAINRKQRVTLKDVAKEAGVNFTLVSKLINRNPQARMTDETRARIAEAIKKLDYRPSASARTLRYGRSKTVGLVSGDLTNAYCAHAADLAIREMREFGYQLLIAFGGRESENDTFRSLLARDVDGIIYLGSGTPRCDALPCPFILNDRRLPSCSEVTLDLDKSLDDALSRVSGRVAGLFFENSLWKDAFSRVAFKRAIEAQIYSLSLDQKIRAEEIRSVIETKPEVIMTSGWHTMTMLLELLDESFVGYTPKLIVHANCRGPFLSDKRICGVIYSSSSDLIKKTCAALVSLIETSSSDAVSLSIPTKFLPSNTQGFKSLYSRHFCLT